MKNVSHDHNPFSLQNLRQGMGWIEMPCQRVQIKQPLAGMAVKAIATIEHHRALSGLIQSCCKLLRDARGAVAHHQHIGTHSHIRPGCIENAFSFAQRAAGRREALNICR